MSKTHAGLEWSQSVRRVPPMERSRHTSRVSKIRCIVRTWKRCGILWGHGKDIYIYIYIYAYICYIIYSCILLIDTLIRIDYLFIHFSSFLSVGTTEEVYVTRSLVLFCFLRSATRRASRFSDLKMRLGCVFRRGT